MKCIILVVASFAVTAKAYPFFGLGAFGALGRIGAQLGSQIGSAIGAVADIGTGALASGASVIEAGAGTLGAGARAMEQSVNQNEAGSEANENNSDESNGESQRFYKRGRNHYHNRRRHHTSVTKIIHSSTSEEHDLSVSREYNERGQKTRAFHNHGSDASNYENSPENDAQEVEDI